MGTAHVSDAEIKNRVELELKWTPELDLTHIGISVTAGSITLSGEVADYSQIESAERAAWKVAGVVAVAQDIGVHRAGGRINDADVAREITSALARLEGIPDGAVHVAVTHGTAFLSGTVPWNFQADAVEKAVRAVDGVRRTTNSIDVSPRDAADSVTAHIVAVLEHDVHSEAHRITISANSSGRIVVEGTARSAAESAEIGRAARGAFGVSSVHNRLRVIA